MKVLVVVHNYLSPSMTFIYNQVQKLRENNEVHVVGSELNNLNLFPFEDLTQIKYPKIDFGYFIATMKRKFGISYAGNNQYYTTNLKKKIAELKPDVIHTHFGLQLIRLEKVIKSSKIKTVVTFHGYDASQLLRNQLYVNKLVELFELPHVFGTTVSAKMKSTLVEVGIRKEKLYVDYLGVDTDFFSPSGNKKSDSITFLQVSNFLQKKGHVYTVKAFANFLKESNQRNIKLILAGAGPLLDSIKKLVEDLNISSHVEFPGLVNRDQVKTLMEQAHYFVHHSVVADNGDSEGIPTVIMEAMSMGLPIISTYHSGIPELIEDKKDGILVSEKDVENYAKAFKEIINTKFDRSVIRAKIVSNFNLENSAKNIFSLFKKL